MIAVAQPGDQDAEEQRTDDDQRPSSLQDFENN
jgi:hypothetical protein